MFGRLYLLTFVSVFIFRSLLAQEVEPLLFADTSLLEVELHYNFDELKRDYDSSPMYHSALLRYKNIWGGMSKFDVDIKTRGIFRRNPNNCSQPPLWVKFNLKDVRNTPFEGVDKVKLVLQCFDRSHYQELLLNEYLIYKLYSIISPYSYQVRLVRVSLIDKISDKRVDMLGFFIEPSEMLAVRLNATLDERKNIHPNACNRIAATQMALFQYMIGNTDWSIKALHNITLLEKEIAAPPIPVPFDFDFSGFVDAPYALPAEHLPIKSVTERYFNGYCRNAEEFEYAFQLFNDKRSEIIHCIDSFNYLDINTRSKAIRYIDDFYDIINNKSKAKKEIIEGCRTD